LRPAALNGSKPLPCGLPGAKYIASSTMSPKNPEKMSMRVRPGKLSFIHCGYSSRVISPYFCFICAVVV
jgi:hypothetical protein